MIRSFNRNLFNINIENYFLVLFLLCYFKNLSPLLNSRNSSIHELNSIEELENNLDICLQDHNITSTICPIDHDRLQLFDNNGIDLNPSLNYGHIKFGGHYKVIGCQSRQKVAIVIPYRDRESHLKQFSLYIHRFLPDQLVDYSIYVIEQSKLKKFNRAKLFNIGVIEILKLDPAICCFIFHDVDLIPLDQRNLYMCSNSPRHMSVGVSSLRYKLLYQTLFGGVVAINRKQFEQIGGFSNNYYGWGGEDDDMFNRITNTGLGIYRTPSVYGLYNSMFHPKATPNLERYSLLKTNESQTTGTDYELVKTTKTALYTTILVNV